MKKFGSSWALGRIVLQVEDQRGSVPFHERIELAAFTVSAATMLNELRSGTQIVLARLDP